jgi:hypothetical protein
VINATGVADNNDGVLTYRLYRNGGNTPIATTTAESWPWTRPSLRFVDQGLNNGANVTYQLQATDGSATGGRSQASASVQVVGGSVPSYSSRVNAASPVSYWPLHTLGPLMADASNQKRTGRIEGGVTRKQQGALQGNNGIVTDGSTGFVRSNAAWTPGSSFSQSVWFKTTSETGGTLMGFSNAPTGAGTANHRAMWMDNDGKVAFGVLIAEIDDPEDVEPQFVRSPARYNDGRWHQAVATYNGTQIALFIDGVRVAFYDRLPDDDPVVATGPGYTRVGYVDLTNFYTVFGRNYDGAPSPTSYFFNGSLDEASVHSTALSITQVAGLWQSGAAVLNNS